MMEDETNTNTSTGFDADKLIMDDVREKLTDECVNETDKQSIEKLLKAYMVVYKDDEGSEYLIRTFLQEFLEKPETYKWIKSQKANHILGTAYLKDIDRIDEKGSQDDRLRDLLKLMLKPKYSYAQPYALPILLRHVDTASIFRSLSDPEKTTIFNIAGSLLINTEKYKMQKSPHVEAYVQFLIQCDFEESTLELMKETHRYLLRMYLVNKTGDSYMKLRESLQHIILRQPRKQSPNKDDNTEDPGCIELQRQLMDQIQDKKPLPISQGLLGQLTACSNESTD